MSDQKIPVALNAIDMPPRPKGTIYPSHLAKAVEGRDKTQLGNAFGLKNFGVNLTRLSPGAHSALRHAHTKQDEFVYILEGRPTLITDEGRTALSPGMCAGFPADTGNGHHLVNESTNDVLYLEIGDRTPGDAVFYPDDDIQLSAGADGKWIVTRKDGTPF
jgi:uncharacterized cupin superfamily protein